LAESVDTSREKNSRAAVHRWRVRDASDRSMMYVNFCTMRPSCRLASCARVGEWSSESAEWELTEWRERRWRAPTLDSEMWKLRIDE
jgi:hypothetical protein